MKNARLKLCGVVLALASPFAARSSATLNTCNESTGECRARVVKVYAAGAFVYVVLEGHLKPTACTGAAWGYYWQMPLATDADKARHSILLSAYAMREAVELRTFSSDCTIYAVGIGED